MKRALVTLVVGDRYRKLFADHAAPTFQAYARAHGLTLVVLDRLLDDSPLGRGRSPAWQKCLIARHPRVRACGQVLWCDADAVINPAAPSAFDGVPAEAFGAVEHFSSPTPEAFAAAAAATRRYRERHGITAPGDATPAEFYRHYGFSDGPDAVVQTGVLVLSPEAHGPILETAYRETRRPDSRDMLFEMRPLSYHLLRQSPARWLDARFNTLWATALVSHYPFLMDQGFATAFRERPDLFARLKAQCVAACLDAAYFLHFAGVADDMRVFRPDRG